MSKMVSSGAQLQCSMGTSPSNLNVLPTGKIAVGSNYIASIQDNVPNLNIMPFGMCTSQANPMVAAATAAAMGVPTPMPCLPLVPAPWAPGGIYLTLGDDSKLALTDDSKCNCAYAGQISITTPNDGGLSIGTGGGAGAGPRARTQDDQDRDSKVFDSKIPPAPTSNKSVLQDPAGAASSAIQNAPGPGKTPDGPAGPQTPAGAPDNKTLPTPAPGPSSKVPSILNDKKTPPIPIPGS